MTADADAIALRRLMQAPSRETWQRLLYRGLLARGKDALALGDAALLLLADTFDRRRCQGVRPADNLALCVRELDAEQFRVARQAADADANRRTTKGERRQNRKRGRGHE